MAKKRFIVRERLPDGSWRWVNPDTPMTHKAAEHWALMCRCDGMSTQIWPEDEARERIETESAMGLPTESEAAK